jgi:heme/copper-type cytochrome/quinol oxidase subunit 1
MATNGRGRRLTAALLLLAAVLLVLGIVLWWGAPEPSFGWFAYQPLPDEASRLVTLSGRRYAAAAAFGTGLLLLGTVVGYAFGRREVGRRQTA